MSIISVRGDFSVTGIAAAIDALNAQANYAYPQARMDAEAVDLLRVDHNACTFEAFLRNNSRQVRMDSQDTNGGLFLARQLESRAAKVLEEPRKPLNGLKLFRRNFEVKPGATSHSVSRVYERGAATIYRGGQRPVSRVTLTQREEIFPARHLVDAFPFSVFEQASADFASFPLFDRGIRAAKRAIDELENELVWNGSSADGIKGILNYPWLDKKVVSTAFSATADVDAMCAEILALIEYPENNSQQAMQANSIGMSHKLYNFLARTRVKDSTGNGSGTTALKFIAENNSAKIPLERFYKCNELADLSIGGSTVQGVFVFNDDEDVIRVVDIQPTTPLPLQSVGFESTQYMYRTFGGVVMPDVGACVLGYVSLTV